MSPTRLLGTAPEIPLAPGRSAASWLPLAAVLTFAALVVRAAWLCDDAYITFRTVENLASGHGPVWNTAERVQAYTHPLWMLLLAGARGLTGELYFTSLVLSIALSLAAAGVVVSNLARSTGGALIAVAVLACSKAFVDYSTSGLEGPLAHVLAALFVLAWLKGGTGARGAFLLALAAAGLLTTRPDALPLIAPALALGLGERRAHWRAALLGFLPLLAWEAFSLVYYGFPFPNTAYAKLASGLPRVELIGQGFLYLGNSLRLDPGTLVAIAAACGIALRDGARTQIALAIGVLLQLAYVVWIGGDFMSGRFLTLALLVAAVILSRSGWRHRQALLVLPLWLAASLLVPRSPLRAPTAYGMDVASPHEHVDARGIADERAYYYHYTGLFSPSRKDESKPHVTRGHPFGSRLRAQGAQVRIADGLGFVGFFAGSEVHLVDPMGLTDPLLARLPIYHGGRLLAPQKPIPLELEWRIGHFVRPVPEGYLETLESGDNRIASGALASYWDDLARITRGELWDADRLSALLRFNLGGADPRVTRYLAGE